MYARKRGVAFGHTLTLGKQNLFVSPIRLMSMLQRYGLMREDISREGFYSSMDRTPYMVDPLLRYLGATDVSALDYSTYEGADTIHDLNQPVPPELREKFDLIIDGGLLEHVFNFPVAIRNCMEMTKVGGHLCLCTVANNYLGHGFYQFSPELFYRIFSPDNGFTIEHMFATTRDVGVSNFLGFDYNPEYTGEWYEVSDPDAIRERVMLVNDMPTGLLILAKRTAALPLFTKTPQQSDYVAQWTEAAGNAKPSSVKRSVLYSWLKNTISPAWKSHLRLHVFPMVVRIVNPWNYRSWIKSQALSSPRHFRKVQRP